jgi:hypothetical protein
MPGRFRWCGECYEETSSRLRLAFDVVKASPHHFFEERRGKRLVEWELNRALGNNIRLQVGFELIDDRGGREQAAVFRESREPDHNLFVPEGRDSVADSFRGVLRYRRADSGANFLQSRAGGLGHCPEVSVDGSRFGVLFLRRYSLCLHSEMLYEAWFNGCARVALPNERAQWIQARKSRTSRCRAATNEGRSERNQRCDDDWRANFRPKR